jgi:hypothetical protein
MQWADNLSKKARKIAVVSDSLSVIAILCDTVREIIRFRGREHLYEMT